MYVCRCSMYMQTVDMRLKWTCVLFPPFIYWGGLENVSKIDYHAYSRIASRQINHCQFYYTTTKILNHSRPIWEWFFFRKTALTAQVGVGTTHMSVLACASGWDTPLLGWQSICQSYKDFNISDISMGFQFDSFHFLLAQVQHGRQCFCGNSAPPEATLTSARFVNNQSHVKW